MNHQDIIKEGNWTTDPVEEEGMYFFTRRLEDKTWRPVMRSNMTKDFVMDSDTRRWSLPIPKTVPALPEEGE